MPRLIADLELTMTRHLQIFVLAAIGGTALEFLYIVTLGIDRQLTFDAFLLSGLKGVLTIYLFMGLLKGYLWYYARKGQRAAARMIAEGKKPSDIIASYLTQKVDTSRYKVPGRREIEEMEQSISEDDLKDIEGEMRKRARGKR